MPPGGSSKHDGSAGGHTGTGHDRVYLPKYKKTQVDRGGTSVKTGDSTELGNWLMLASGSGILLLLLMGLRRRAEEENGEA